MGEIHNTPIVLDNGSGTIRAGFAGDDLPKCFFPSYVGRPKHLRVLAGALEGDVFIGKRAEELRGLLKINYPLEHGIVTDWDDMEKIWNFVYQEELKTMSEEVSCYDHFPRPSRQHALYGGFWSTVKVANISCLSASSTINRASIESSNKPRHGRSNPFRNLQCPCPIPQHSSCPLPLRLWPNDRHSPGCWRWCIPCCTSI